MLKKTLLLVLLALLLALGAALPASAGPSAPLSGHWNRLSGDQSQPAPEHELLDCVNSAGTSSDPWFCRYSKRPEPTLSLAWNNRQGFLSGHDVTATWSCPNWFPTGICPEVVQVVEGTMNFTQPSVGFSLAVLEDLVVTQTSSGQALYVYWVNFGFECPWFRTFGDAVAANPLTLPFNGTWPPQDCVAG